MNPRTTLLTQEGKLLVEEYKLSGSSCGKDGRCQLQESWALEGEERYGAGKGKESCRAIGRGIGKVRNVMDKK